MGTKNMAHRPSGCPCCCSAGLLAAAGNRWLNLDSATERGPPRRAAQPGADKPRCGHRQSKSDSGQSLWTAHSLSFRYPELSINTIRT